MSNMYDVQGVLYPRPFKATRLGHLGLWQADLAGIGAVYTDLLGFKQTDQLLDKSGELVGIFTTCNTDHHAMVALSPVSADPVRRHFYDLGVTLNQISFQVNTLKEVSDAHEFFLSKGVKISRIGRDLPGSNWAVYAFDPDGHRVEFFYGMEQIGWSGKSKPQAMYNRLPYGPFALPQSAEEAEVCQARDSGIDLDSGFAAASSLPYAYEVGGIMMQRPFKVGQIGPVRIFAADVDASVAFYTEIAGLYKTEEVIYRGHRCVFLRVGTEHHSVAIMPLALRAELQMNAGTTLLSVGVAVQSYRQLKDAVVFLREHGLKEVSLPAELHPGIDYAAHFMLDDLHCLQLYFQMEQVGHDGQPRPAHERRVVQQPWPDALPGTHDSFAGQLRQGPLA